MNSTVDACLRSWSFDPCLVVALLVAAGVYLRGWLIQHRLSRQRWHFGRLVAFFGGLTIIYLALASPIEPFASLLLQVHMLQHLLLMMVAPPLLWLGAPLLPLLRGLPRSVRILWVAPLLSSPLSRRLFGKLTHPLTALPIFVATTWIWHLPSVYDLALRSSGWHYLQHLCFLSAALLFWFPVVQPYPARPFWSSWLLFPYLIAADLSNTVLSAVLTFSDRVLYPYYAEMPRLGGLSALDDQSAAGVLMWVPGSIVFLLPLFVLGVRLLSGTNSHRSYRRTSIAQPQFRKDQIQGLNPLSERVSLPLVVPHRLPDLRLATPASWDLLRVPLVGRFLKWPHARLCMQIPLLLLAAVVIYDGVCGPQVSAMNLAGVLPWIHWRALVVLGLLAAGNVFCMGCPFLLPRTLARRWLPVGWNWPRRLRSKWLAVLLLIAFLWAYEAFSLWDSPRWTACLALGYFIAAFVIDTLFRGASFCKYLCPIGQFNFVQSLASPLEIKVRDPAVCDSCRTKDCIRGRPSYYSPLPSGTEAMVKSGHRGCEMHLFLPQKIGNMDCTTCLDCVHACPHDNVGLLAVPPGIAIWDDRQRSGIGRFGGRPDLAALVLVLVFGSFANAAGMIGPTVELQEWLVTQFGSISPLWMTTAYYLFAVVLVPFVAVLGASVLSRRWGQLKAGTAEVSTRFAYTLAPLGFGMWLAHYCFHFLTSYETAIPAAQRFAADFGLTVFGEPVWSRACCRPGSEWLLPLEIVFLDLGLLLSLYTGYRLAMALSPQPAVALKALTPWALLMLLLFATGIWILFQPMQMRGTL